MPYEPLRTLDVDLSKLGFGDSLFFEFDKEKCYLRITIFEDNRYQDHLVIDLVDECGVKENNQ